VRRKGKGGERAFELGRKLGGRENTKGAKRILNVTQFQKRGKNTKSQIPRYALGGSFQGIGGGKLGKRGQTNECRKLLGKGKGGGS